MTLLFLLLALAGFVAVGIGAALLRANGRPPLTGGYAEITRAWFTTLHGQRAVGAGVVALGALVLIFVLALRP